MDSIKKEKTVKRLSRNDKFRLVQFILSDLAEEESAVILKNGEEYPVWSPYNAHEAAETLTNELNKHNSAFAMKDKKEGVCV